VGMDGLRLRVEPVLSTESGPTEGGAPSERSRGIEIAPAKRPSSAEEPPQAVAN
jgi:hypothetical protein